MPLTRNFLQVPFSSKGPRRFPKGERKALWSPPQRRNPAKQRKARKPPSLPSTRNQLTCGPPFASKGVPRRFPKGERKALWSPPQRRNPAKQRKARKPPSLPSTRNQLTCGTPHSLQKECPEGFQRASGKPFGRLRRGETPRNRGKQGSLLPCHPQEIYFLWEVSSACGRTRYFPRAGKYPKGAGGGQRVHAAWPPPVPPLLRNSAPLASQGRAPLVLLRTWEGRCRLRRSRSLPRCVGAG